MTRRPRLRHRFEYLFFRAAMFVCGAMPRRLVSALGAGAGWLLGVVFRLRRAVVDQNLAIVFGDALTREERNRIARGAYAHFGAVIFDMLRLWGRPPSELAALVEQFEGEDHLARAADAHGGAAIIVSGHFGFWELAGPAVTSRGRKMCPVAKPIHNPYLDAMVKKARSLPNYQIVPTSGSIRDMVRRAKEGWVLAFIADQDARRDGIFIDFLGKPASTATGPAAFAVKLGLPIVPFFITRLPNGFYRMEFEEPIAPPEGMETQAAIEWLTRRHTERLEQRIRQNPRHYWWFHRRWKTRPKTQSESNQKKELSAGPEMVTKDILR
jgi:KDO2-lipid IV(A) lauroyltransferase